MVVDDIWATIGTTNFDNRSFAHNEENNVCVYDRELAWILREAFIADLAGCDRIDYARWRHRGVLARIQEFIASLFQEQT
jgi:cardiolipin synthase